MTVTEVPSNHAQPVPASSARSEISIVQALRSELDVYYAEMRAFSVQAEPGLIFTRLAAMSARASEVRGQAQRSQSNRLTAFRTKELDPFLDECDRQFRLWSRAQSVRQMEWDVAKGFS